MCQIMFYVIFLKISTFSKHTKILFFQNINKKIFVHFSQLFWWYEIELCFFFQIRYNKNLYVSKNNKNLTKFLESWNNFYIAKALHTTHNQSLKWYWCHSNPLCEHSFLPSRSVHPGLSKMKHSAGSQICNDDQKYGFWWLMYFLELHYLHYLLNIEFQHAILQLIVS